MKNGFISRDLNINPPTPTPKNCDYLVHNHPSLFRHTDLPMFAWGTSHSTSTKGASLSRQKRPFWMAGFWNSVSAASVGRTQQLHAVAADASFSLPPLSLPFVLPREHQRQHSARPEQASHMNCGGPHRPVRGKNLALAARVCHLCAECWPLKVLCRGGQSSQVFLGFFFFFLYEQPGRQRQRFEELFKLNPPVMWAGKIDPLKSLKLWKMDTNVKPLLLALFKLLFQFYFNSIVPIQNWRGPIGLIIWFFSRKYVYRREKI